MGGCFWKRRGKWGVFCNKEENGEVFFVKKWTFPQRRVDYVQYQYFLFYILLIWGCVRTQRTPCLRARGFRQTLAGTRAEGVSRVSSYYYKHYP